MITVRVPDNFMPERTYSIDMLFQEFLGLEYRIVPSREPDYEIGLGNGSRLLVRDHFFGKFTEQGEYLDAGAVPGETAFLENGFHPLRDIPVIFGTDELSIESGSITCGIDLFASSFFMLSRWEEYVNQARDGHGRFPAHASLAFKQGFLHRPVVNEYVELLWNMLRRLKCSQARKCRAFRTFATHDVDEPFANALKNPYRAVKQFGGDLLKRRAPGRSLMNFNSWLKTAGGSARLDTYNTFSHIMDKDEKYGLEGTFLFITDHSRPEYDGDYDIGHKLVRRLIGDIRARGHNVGLHSSYGSFDDPHQMKRELDILKTVCAQEGFAQQKWMSRQHFLRWNTPATSNCLETAGVDVDTTLAYADHSGFRCGVCYEYPVFDILARQQLNLRERPLLVMECTVMDDRYMGLGAGLKAYTFIRKVKDTCRRFGGDFVVLWHNTRFVDPRESQLYDLVMQD